MHAEEDSNFDMLTILLQDGKQGMETRWSIQACEEPNEFYGLLSRPRFIKQDSSIHPSYAVIVLPLQE